MCANNKKSIYAKLQDDFVSRNSREKTSFRPKMVIENEAEEHHDQEHRKHVRKEHEMKIAGKRTGNKNDKRNGIIGYNFYDILKIIRRHRLEINDQLIELVRLVLTFQISINCIQMRKKNVTMFSCRWVRN